MGGGCPRSIGERVGVLAKVGCPPSTPDNDTSVITMGGGVVEGPDNSFESETRVKFCEKLVIFRNTPTLFSVQAPPISVLMRTRYNC